MVTVTGVLHSNPGRTASAPIAGHSHVGNIPPEHFQVLHAGDPKLPALSLQADLGTKDCRHLDHGRTTLTPHFLLEG